MHCEAASLTVVQVGDVPDKHRMVVDPELMVRMEPQSGAPFPHRVRLVCCLECCMCIEDDWNRCGSSLGKIGRCASAVRRAWSNLRQC